MHTTTYLAAIAAIAVPAFAQTFTSCNPLQKKCDPNPALGKSVQYDFSKGAPADFTPAQGTQPVFDSNGGNFKMSKPGDGPTLVSNWYIMFGNVKVVMKPASGQGIISSIVLESIDLDEVDWEWVGNDLGNVQTNYFGKGNTSVYDRGVTVKDLPSSTGYNTYEIDWTQDHIQWIINGTVVRTLTPATADAGQYPQTPMQLKIGDWSGGDSTSPGTVTWAGGKTQWQNAPFNMIVKSVTVSDYSTGTSYEYSNTDGTWQSIKSNGGQIMGQGKAPSSVSTASAVGSTLTAKPTVSALSQEATGLPTTTQAVPTGQVGNGVAVPSGSSGNATVGITPTQSGSSTSASSTGGVTGAGSMVQPAVGGLFMAGLLAVLAL